MTRGIRGRWQQAGEAIGPPATFHARVRETLRKDILDGRLKVHQQLPSETELTALFGVSRITVRQALDDLKRQGLVVKLQGKGTFVARPAPVSASFDDVEGLSAATAASGRVILNRRLALSAVRAPAAVARELAVDAGSTVIRLDTLRSVDGVPLSVNRSWMPEGAGRKLARLDLSHRDVVDVIERDLGLQVAGARTEIRAMHPTLAQARRLRVSADLACLSVHRVLLAPAGDALDYEVALYRGDIYSHRSTVRRAADAPAAGDDRLGAYLPR